MDGLQRIVLSLKIGDAVPLPAPPELMQALQAVEITQADTAPSGFQLTFHTEVVTASGQSYQVVQDALLQPFKRVVIAVAVDGVPQTLMDGFITQQQLVPSDQPGGSVFVVTGEDVSVQMDVFELSMEYPAMGDAAIVALVLAKYMLFGIEPRVQPTPIDLVPFGYVPQQNGTDRAWLMQLAQQNGNVFYVTPGTSPLTNIAYWGPPQTAGSLQPPLDVNMGPFTNVASISFAFDSLAPFLVLGFTMETEVDPYVPVPTVTLASSRVPPLAARPVLDPSDLTSMVKKKLWIDQGMNPVKSLAVAQGMTDLSADRAVVAQGQLEVTRYGGILTAPGLVAVRGAGPNYDGKYYVKQVEHHIRLLPGSWNYTQDFTLTREGLGTTIQRV